VKLYGNALRKGLKTMFKLIVAGGRDFDDYCLLCSSLEKLLSNKTPTQIEIVEGGARGADRMGRWYAKDMGLSHKRFNANWDTHGKKAGFMRNIEMAAYADALAAYWDGESKGTAHMIETMKKMGKPVRIIRYVKEEGP
jgi:hypothetical protein